MLFNLILYYFSLKETLYTYQSIFLTPTEDLPPNVKVHLITYQLYFSLEACLPPSLGLDLMNSIHSGVQPLAPFLEQVSVSSITCFHSLDLVPYFVDTILRKLPPKRCLRDKKFVSFICLPSSVLILDCWSCKILCRKLSSTQDSEGIIP